MAAAFAERTRGPGSRVSDCCSECGEGAFGPEGAGGCCCCSEDGVVARTLDVLGTCMHRIAWHYYREETELLEGGAIYLPPLQLGVQLTTGTSAFDCEVRARRTREELLRRPLMDVASQTCPAPLTMALIMEAETALLAVWPYQVREEEQAMSSGTVLEAMRYLEVARTHIRAQGARGAAPADWPFPAALRRTDELLHLIDVGQPPNASWYSGAGLLGQYHVTVTPTPPRVVWDTPVPSGPIRPSLATVRRSFFDVVGAFRRLRSVFFPVKGSLVGLLRYGSTIGELPGDKLDLVDNDLDFWVVASDERWAAFCQGFAREMLRLGFLACTLALTGQGPGPQRVLRTLTCLRMEPSPFRVEVSPFEVAADQLVPSEGSALPYDLVFPLRRCKAFNSSVPCPQRPAAFLRARGAGSCLALPVILPTRDCLHPWNQRLREGWSPADAGYLRRIASNLSQQGFASFDGEEEELCANHRVVDDDWWRDCQATGR